MPVPALHFSQVSKAYGNRAVLQGVDLNVRQGDFFGLVGVNGAGKTTLLKCLLDFSEPDSGSIEIFGISHRDYHSRQQLAFLPERFAPPYYLTGRDFLHYMLRLRGQGYDPSRVAEIIEALDLDPDSLEMPVSAYSKGMTQKLGLAACFLSDRPLFLLDEPMSGLDPKARVLLKRHLQGIRKRGHTLFFSSHALADVEEICDHMAILHQGGLRFAGTPDDCLRHFGTNSLEDAFMNCIAPTGGL